jgi:hypothetical protein
MGHRRLRQSDRGGEVADARFPSGACRDERQEPDPGRISQGLEDLRDVLRLRRVERVFTGWCAAGVDGLEKECGAGGPGRS